MKHLKAAGIGALAFLFLNGIQAVSDPLAAAGNSAGQHISLNTGDKTRALVAELKRLQAVNMIGDLLQQGMPDFPDGFRRQLAQTVYEASSLFDINAVLLLAVIEVESSFRTDARSEKGAVGLMQLMPKTGEALSVEMQMPEFRKAMLMDVRTNVLLGAYYLKKLIDRYGRLDYALTAYNMGETRFDLARAEAVPLSYSYAARVQRNVRKLNELQQAETADVE